MDEKSALTTIYNLACVNHANVTVFSNTIRTIENNQDGRYPYCEYHDALLRKCSTKLQKAVDNLYQIKHEVEKELDEYNIRWNRSHI